MGFERVQKLADTVLLEGYVLYPYRATSAKNRYRWTFGVLAPRAWSDAGGCESWWLEARCLMSGASSVAGRLRFMRVVDRIVEAGSDDFRWVAELVIDGTSHVPWEEGEIREIDFHVPANAVEPVVVRFEIPADRETQLLRDTSGTVVGRVVRVRRALEGTIVASVEKLDDSLRRLVVRVENTTPFDDTGAARELAMHASCCSTHVLLQNEGGAFVSLTDPPDDAREAAAACVNVGTYPALCGEDTFLCSPIILEDDPKIAPESPGDFFDACEIDEILTLRTMTLTDGEKNLARATDARSAAIVDRVDSLPREAMARLHGTFRDRLKKGSRVRLKLGARRTDAQDLLYADRAAVIEEVKQDIDGRECFAVTFEDDPAAELHRWYGRFHYYYADEVEPI